MVTHTLTMDPELERTVVLARDTFFHAIHSLCAMLPVPVSDDPKAVVRRDSAAMAQLAALIPVNADEVAQAVAIAAATAHAGDVLRMASERGEDGMKMLPQAASLMRQANAARSLLLRSQAARRIREADNAAADSAAWTEYYALRDMLEALGRKANGEPDETAGRTPTDPPVVTPAAPSASAGPVDDVSDSGTSSEISTTETAPRRAEPEAEGAAPNGPAAPTPPAGPAIEAEPRRPPYPEAARLDVKPPGDMNAGNPRLAGAAVDPMAELVGRAKLFATTSLFSTTRPP